MDSLNKLILTNLKYTIDNILYKELKISALKELSTNLSGKTMVFNILFLEFNELRKLHNDLKFYL